MGWLELATWEDEGVRAVAMDTQSQQQSEDIERGLRSLEGDLAKLRVINSDAERINTEAVAVAHSLAMVAAKLEA